MGPHAAPEISRMTTGLGAAGSGDKTPGQLTVSPATPGMETDVERVIHAAVRSVYPKYYPAEVVDYFLRLHSREHIAALIASGAVKVLCCSDNVIGTGCCSEGHISAVYVHPDFQGRGFGTRLMDVLEREALGTSSAAVLEASLPAVMMYERRGYRTTRHEKLVLSGGCVLIYEVMEKRLHA